MADDLLTYYERELSFLRQIGAEFAAKYPKIAGRLLLEADKSADPHVERLIQAFAFLAARIHHKIDDEFPEITNALLGVLYPHYLAPIPSMSIVQFVPDPDQGKLTSGHRIERGAMLYTQPANGTPCRFRTCYRVTLWPVEVASARLDTASHPGSFPKGAVAVIRLELRCLGGTRFAELDLDHLRFFLYGESSLTFALYELLLNNACQVQLRPMGGSRDLKPSVLPPNCLRAVGFGHEEGMLPYTPRSFPGYRLLQEYFTFPEKFLFCDLCEIDRAVQAGYGGGMEVLIYLDRVPRLEQPVSAATFRLGCTPIVNLFEQIAEPIRVSHAQTEYRVIPDVRRQHVMEVYAIEAVTSTVPGQQELMHFQPFYSFKHTADRERQEAFWYATRRPSQRRGDAGTEVSLALVDLNFQPTLPAVETLTVYATCTNRDLAGKLPFGGDRGDLYLEGAAPLT
ncbi:MAG: type VI secretion system baseplate subunit TssF, partial [Candidatus Entotheonellia bacterium]